MDENQNATAEEQAIETEQETFTKEEFDRRVDEAVKTARASWDVELGGKLEEAKNEGARLAKLSAEERQKEENRAEREKFEQEKAEFAHKSLVAETVKQLGEKGIPVEFAEMAAGADAETAQANIKMLEKAWKNAVEKAVDERIKASAATPMYGTNSHMSGVEAAFYSMNPNLKH